MTETTPDFVDLLNARCAAMGILGAAELAQRIVRIQPAAGRVDIARSVRNWQAGRNLPRPDFYRILLQALEVDRDPELRETWHRAYRDAKATRVAATPPAPPDAQPTSPAPERPGTRPIPTSPPWGRRATIAVGAAFLAVGLAATAMRTEDHAAACDAAANASWDPQRAPAHAPVAASDIPPEAVAACEGAVRRHPEAARHWFQLGRALASRSDLKDDPVEAISALRRAVDLGHAGAALRLAMLLEDTGTEPDLAEAADLYARAAEAGLPMGLHCHAVATLHGWSGGPPDPGGAATVARAAVAAGSGHARGLLADLERRAPLTRHTGCGIARAAMTWRRIDWTSEPPEGG